MKEPELTVTNDDFIITIPRSLHEGRVDRLILATLAQALSIEGLLEAAEYFRDETERRKKLSALAQALEKDMPKGDADGQ
ncbi:MAG: hypothetical protein ABSE69_09205 [Roseiarcus sp.]|jgi:hypothetical protein